MIINGQIRIFVIILAEIASKWIWKACHFQTDLIFYQENRLSGIAGLIHIMLYGNVVLLN